MAHSRNDSLESMASTLSTLTSCSSDASVELYQEVLKPGIDAVTNGDTPLANLVSAAEGIINEIFAPDSRRTYKYTKDSEEISVELDKIMNAMLACADECGGECGKRYVASAIVTCSKEEDAVGALAALGTTWLTHLLFIFKTSRGHGNQPNKKPSGFATPTVDKTAIHLLEGVGNRKKSFHDDVMIRDGYTCVITGYQDSSHPNPVEDTARVRLVAAHILRRAIGEFDEDHNSKSFKSAVTTFDILVNFTRLPVKTLEELGDQLDNPSNGLILEKNAHEAFDSFNWCLRQTEEEHVYDLKIFNYEGILRKPESNRISFKDHSDDFSPHSTRKRNLPVDLPDPHLIAIHAAIAGILNMSGAGKFFDELLDKYTDEEGNVPAVRSWPELETLMVEGLVSASVTEALQSITAY
ncbi:hypothetical protein H0H81_002791 [Sphagnurus paluster]|uniref:HNH nuclease domain-containing protein n=1 Tax=Sphagnurus paluster TaxID=117069 RepID=A0A9P7GGN3_9AGAR|nr:hypothetical protein H0H81_002791 [Sphagnurus paluster]